jgi:hypothetical protein
MAIQCFQIVTSNKNTKAYESVKNTIQILCVRCTFLHRIGNREVKMASQSRHDYIVLGIKDLGVRFPADTVH